MKPRISILIPFYNGGSLFDKTINSIINQSFDDFEVVCVDDFSDESNKKRLQEWAEKDKRIKVVHRDKKGGTAVKGVVYGLPYCNGEYFFYLSQDDLLDRDCLKLLYEKAVKTNADIVVPDMYNYCDDRENHGGIFAPGKDYDSEISGKQAFLLCLEWKLHGFGLKKMSFVRRVGYDDLLFNSDEYAARIQYYYAKKIVFSKAKFFYRVDNENAVTHGGLKPIYRIEYGSTNLRLLNFIKENHIHCVKQEFMLFKGCCGTYWNCHKRKFLLPLNEEEKKKCNVRLDELIKGIYKYAIERKRIDYICEALIVMLKGKFDNV